MKTLSKGSMPLTMVIIVVAVLALAGGFYVYQELKIKNQNQNEMIVEEATRVSSIKVLSPNGEEQLVVGQSVTIQWLLGNAPIDLNVVSVQLLTPDAVNQIGCWGYPAGTPGRVYDCRYYSLFDDIQNNGSITWTVGKDSTGAPIPEGKYYLRIYFSEVGMTGARGLTEKNYKLEDYSDAPFSLIKANQDETTNWKTYRNEKYGFEFSYPALYILKEVNRSNEVGLTGLDRTDINLSIDNKSAVDIRLSCNFPENVPESFRKDNFQNLEIGNGYFTWYTGPLNASPQNLIQTFFQDGIRIYAFRQGCYECYDVGDSRGNIVANPELKNDGFSAVACATGLNKQKHQAVRCLTLETKRLPKESEELLRLKDFILKDLIPSFKFSSAFQKLDNCVGAGEGRG